MRSASEVINTILEFARNDYRIRVVGMEARVRIRMRPRTDIRTMTYPF